MRKSLMYTLAAGALFGLIGVSSAQAGEAEASMLANTCNGCHGPDGVSQGPAAPTIAGMNKFYLTESLKAYRDGKNRPSTIMARIAKGYSDSEIEKIAGYFSAKPFGRVAMQNTDVAKAMKGKALVKDLCESCHEKEGFAAEDYPVLAGQMLPYLRNNLADFKSGLRSIDANPNMSDKEKRKKKRTLAELRDKHGADGVEAVLQFYASRK
ncbi:MAG: c-type cytochrome [Magnetovibrio sp.]|nr:c-type cytochrome [Magnetovibrio sp.]